MTFSIAARCSVTGELGVAVSTAVPAVGAMCPYVRAGVGAVSTQSWVNPYLALGALDRLEEGEAAQDVLEYVMKEDPAAALRQIGIVDRFGRSASWTGAQCTGWAGHRVQADCAIQGNMLTGAATLDAMQSTFDASVSHPLAERLMRALEAGQAAGGDKRGRQSAALKVFRREAYPFLDLRVDDHPDPVPELRRLFGVAQRQFVPFVEAMPSRDDPGRVPPDAVTALLLTPPPLRPGAQEASALDDAQRLSRWIGVDFAADRAAHNLGTYAPILDEIRRLRALDLSDVHPAVVFNAAPGD